MKRTFILSAVGALFVTLVFSSCKPSRVWATKKKNKADKEYYEAEAYRQPPPPPPRYYNSTPLIITPTPGFVMKQQTNGRFYHRTQSGLLYWKGYDNRFYIDQSYLRRISYSKWEYDEWKRYSRQSR